MKYFLALIILFCISFGVQAEVVQQEVEYQAKDDVVLKGFVAYDNSTTAERPGVLVVHEWWGHNQYARDRAVMLAELGYVAFAVDMYGNGKLAAHPEDAQKFSSEIANNMSLGKARFEAAMQQLIDHPLTSDETIAAIGYCFGGAVVLQMAREGVDLAAVAAFHASLTTPNPAQQGKVKAKVFVAHGAADPFIKPEDITGFMQEMNAAGVDYTFTAYGGAVHSFTSPSADEFGEKFNLPLAYDEKADKASWRDMQMLFDEVFQ